MTNGDAIRTQDNDSLAFGFLMFMRMGETRAFEDIPSKELHKILMDFLDSPEDSSPDDLKRFIQGKDSVDVSRPSFFNLHFF